MDSPLTAERIAELREEAEGVLGGLGADPRVLAGWILELVGREAQLREAAQAVVDDAVPVGPSDTSEVDTHLIDRLGYLAATLGSRPDASVESNTLPPEDEGPSAQSHPDPGPQPLEGHRESLCWYCEDYCMCCPKDSRGLAHFY